MDSWASKLIPGTVLARSGLYNVNHTCSRKTQAVYLFEGAILPSCPDCLTTMYRFIAAEEESQRNLDDCAARPNW